MQERSVAGSTEPDMREKGKHCSRSAGFADRRVIVHRSADRGALRSSCCCTAVSVQAFVSCLSLLSLLCCERKLRLVLQESFAAAAAAAASDGISFNFF